MLDTASIFTTALGISEPWYVEEVTFDDKSSKLEIYLNFRKGSYFPYCNEDGTIETATAYDTVEKRWRHLNFFQHECYLVARTPRVKNKSGKIQTYAPEWSGLSKGFTLLFEAIILQLAKDMPINKIGKMLNVSDKIIWNLLDQYIEKARKFEDYSNVSKIGIDETSQAKGHEYISLFVDLENRRTMFVTVGKGSETVTEFKKDFTAHKGNIDNITDVSCDMSRAFIKGVTDNMPNAKITFDKFHIIKLINKAVDDVRRQEAKDNPILKGTRYVFLKNKNNLTKNQQKLKEQLVLANINLKSMTALNMRETFQQIYLADTYDDFVTLLQKWYQWVTGSGLDSMIKVAKTIKEHWDGIIAWKKSQINNGVLEGLNSVIQAAKRKARGYKLKHLKTIAYLITSNLNFKKLNQAC
jgi:transposase